MESILLLSILQLTYLVGLTISITKGFTTKVTDKIKQLKGKKGLVTTIIYTILFAGFIIYQEVDMLMTPKFIVSLLATYGVGWLSATGVYEIIKPAVAKSAVESKIIDINKEIINKLENLTPDEQAKLADEVISTFSDKGVFKQHAQDLEQK